MAIEFDIRRFSPVGAESTDGARVFSYSIPSGQTMSEVLDDLSVQSIALGHPLGYFDDLADQMERGNILFVVDSSLTALPEFVVLVCTGSGYYSDGLPYCRFNVWNGRYTRELSGSSESISGNSLSNAMFTYDGSTAYTLTIDDDASTAPYQDGATFTVINTGTAAVLVEGDTANATFNGQSSASVEAGTVAVFYKGDGQNWTLAASESTAPDTQQIASSAQSAFTVYGSEIGGQIDGRGKWIRTVAAGNVTVSIDDDGADWEDGDYMYIIKSGSGGATTIQGLNATATFNGSASVSLAAQYDAVRLVCIEAATDEWEVFTSA